MEIRDLSARYALATDARDFDAVGRVFSDDVVYGRVAGNEIMGCGRQAALAFMQAHFEAHPAITFHYIHDVIIDFDATDPNRAKGAVVSHVESRIDGQPLVHAVRYRDDYVRSDLGWRIVGRWVEFPLR